MNEYSFSGSFLTILIMIKFNKGEINISKSIWRSISQVTFLFVFAFLLLQGKVQAWIIFLGAAAVSSLLLGRVYCGWACPMGTLMRIQSWLYEKLKFSRFTAPSFLKSIWIRVMMVVAFFAGMIAVRVVGIKLNIILYLVYIGVGLSFIFGEDFWHTICPHGSILNVTGRVAPLGMKVFRDNCTTCGLCEEVCPNEAIMEEAGTNIRTIDSNECLVCYNCSEICPTKVISYGRSKKEKTTRVVNN